MYSVGVGMKMGGAWRVEIGCPCLGNVVRS